MRATIETQAKEHSERSKQQLGEHERELRSQMKAEGIRESDVKHLQEMIGSKDAEIEELQKKIEMLKENHLNELAQKERQVEEARGQL